MSHAEYSAVPTTSQYAPASERTESTGASDLRGMTLEEQRQHIRCAPASVWSGLLVRGKRMGSWGRGRGSGSAIRGGIEVPSPNAYLPGFKDRAAAEAWAAVQVAQQGADGMVVVEHEGRFTVFTVVVETWIDNLTRSELEESPGADWLDIAQAEVPGVCAFVTQDGYTAPVRQNGEGPLITSYEQAGTLNGAKSTSVPALEGFEQVAAQVRDCGVRLNPAASLALFKGMVKAEALQRLQSTRTEIQTLMGTMMDGALNCSRDGQGESRWDAMKALMQRDEVLSAKETALADMDQRAQDAYHETERGLRRECMASCHSGPTQQATTRRPMDLVQAHDDWMVASQKLSVVRDLRSELRAEHPAIALAAGTHSTDSSSVIYEQMSQTATDFYATLDDLEQRIHTEDMPLSKLDPVLAAVKGKLGVSEQRRSGGDTMSQAALDWVDSEQAWETALSVGSAVISGGLGLIALGCLFVPGGFAATASIVGAAAGASGAAVGLGGAIYSYERAADLALAAEVDDTLVSDPEAAKSAYTMAKIDLALSLLDVVLTVADLVKLARVGAVATELTQASKGAPVDLAELTPAEKLEVGRSIHYGEGNLSNLDAVRQGDAITFPEVSDDPATIIHWMQKLPEQERVGLASNARRYAGRGRVTTPQGISGPTEGSAMAIIGRDRNPNFHRVKSELSRQGPVTSIDDIVASQRLKEIPESWSPDAQFWAERNGLRWNPTANLAWLQGIVDRRLPVVVSDSLSPSLLVSPGGGPSFTKREIDFLVARGYTYDPIYTGPGAARLLPPARSALH